MSVRMMALSLVLTVAATGSAEAAPQSREEAVRQAAVRGALGGAVAGNRCFTARPDDTTAIQTRFDLLPASRLEVGAVDARPGFPLKVGAYLYEGRGVIVWGDDPRFVDLTIDPRTSQPSLPDGRKLVVSNLVWSEAGGDCRLALTTPATEANRGTREAATAGAAPVLEGYRVGATWPSYRQGFIGVMHPDIPGENGADETVIVTFQAGTDHATQVQARLPIAIQGLTMTPDLHRPRTHLRLTGVQQDGSLIELVLVRDDSPPSAPSASEVASPSEP